MEWTRQVAALRGWAFEGWYGAPPRLLKNVCFLAGYRRRALIDEQLIPAVLEAAGGSSPATDGERRVRGAHPALVRPVVMHLLWSGDLVTDMGRPLGGDSMIWPPGESGSVRGAVVIGPGSRFTFDGEVVEVTGFEGTRVTLRDGRDRWRMLGLAGFLAGGVPLEAPEGRPDPVGPMLAGLSGGEQSVVTERAGHVREVLTGYRSGTAEAARPGEPRPDYDPARGSSP